MIRDLFNGGSEDASDQEDSDDADTGPSTLTGESYAISEERHERQGGVRTKTLTEEEGKVAGPKVREMMERGVNDPEHDLWVGYDEDPQEGFREAGIPFENLFRHLWIAGVTGAGKTTEMINWMIQMAYSGHGFVYFDPKGKDSRELLRKLPEDRLDDVVWIEPGTDRDKEIGLNMLDVPDTDSEVDLETSIENRVDNLKASFAAKGELHSTMEAVTESVGRSMMHSNADPDAKDFSVLDFYFVLLEESRRESFAEECDDPFIAEFLREIAEMDDEDLRYLLKRVKPWAENAVIRRIVARRESSVNWRELIDNDRIVIVRTPVESDDIKRLVTLTVMRGIWSAVQSRSYETVGDPDPFFVFADEFDDIASEQLDMKSMLARARSMRLGVCIACQYPSQLDRSELKPLKNNADNLVTFRANDDEDARILMNRFRGYNADDLIETHDFNVWTQLPLGGGEYSEAVKLQTFAPYPPLRSEDAIEDVIEASLDRFGDEPLTDAEIQQSLPYGDVAEAIDEDDDLDMDDESEKRILKAAFDESIHSDADVGGFVPADASGFEARAREYLDAPQMGTGKLWSLIDYVPEDLLEREDRGDDGMYVRCTERGRTRFLATGDAENSGGGGHRELLKDVYVPLTKLGFRVELPSQDGSDLPDGILSPDEILPETNHLSPVEVAEQVEEVRAEHPVVTRLTDLEDAALEAESKTSTKPAQTIYNLSQAVNRGQRCVFLVRESDASTVANALDGYVKTVEDGVEELYNRRPVKIDGDVMLRPDNGAQSTVWQRDTTSGELFLEDSNGERHATFPDADSVWEDADRYPATEGTVEDESEWKTVYEPRVPERVFDGEPPGSDVWDMVVVPSDASDPDDLELLVDGDLRVPLTSIGGVNETDGTEVTDETDTKTQKDGTGNSADASGETAREIFDRL